ncbi:hypothetical protein AALA21_01065 [Eggerthellaceae bacterium 3-80]|nr:hypothetical protein D7W09_01240 [bacterium D16-34]
MYELYDRVEHLPTGKSCIIIDIEDGIDEETGIPVIVYALEVEDQSDQDWFYWAEESEIMRLQK